jgi:hypothetical protein
MNERFKELAVQSDLWRMLEEYSWEFGSCDPEKDCGRIEKFAELIVRECIEQVITGPNGPAHYAVEAALRLKKHFGVE